MELILHRFELPLQHTFTISRGSVDVQETLVVELRHQGQAGFGEATTNSYYNATLSQMVADLRRIEPLIGGSGTVLAAGPGGTGRQPLRALCPRHGDV